MAGPHSLSNGPVAQINITPLIDVLLVLLIIFLVSAPVLTQSQHAALPQPAPDRPSEQPVQLQVRIGSDGAYRLDGRPLSDAELWSQLQVAAAADPRLVLQIQADAAADYQRLATLLSESRSRGVQNIGLMQ